MWFEKNSNKNVQVVIKIIIMSQQLVYTHLFTRGEKTSWALIRVTLTKKTTSFNSSAWETFGDKKKKL